jgi:hypothetical protein
VPARRVSLGGGAGARAGAEEVDPLTYMMARGDDDDDDD